MPPRTAYNLRIPCLYTATEVSIRRQNKREVGIRRIPAYTPQYTPGDVGHVDGYISETVQDTASGTINN